MREDKFNRIRQREKEGKVGHLLSNLAEEQFSVLLGASDGVPVS